MESALTKRQSISARDSIQEQIPVWLQYLIGAYPQQRPNAMTHAVMESQFSEFGPDIMLQAVKAYVAEGAWWPSVSELRQCVNKLKQPGEQWKIPFHIWHRVWSLKNWTKCAGPCGELTPSLEDCPFCEDM